MAQRRGGAAGDEELLTVAQVAERLQVNPETVRRWLRGGRLRGLSLGRRGGYRITDGEYRRFIAEAQGPGYDASGGGTEGKRSQAA
jgi:excisionase family DNA binding protein